MIITNNLTPDLESALPGSHVCQFLGKTYSFEFFGLNLGNCPIKGNILVLIIMRVLQRDRWGLNRAGWRWMELGGVKWRLMDLGGGGCTV